MLSSAKARYQKVKKLLKAPGPLSNRNSEVLRAWAEGESDAGHVVELLHNSPRGVAEKVLPYLPGETIRPLLNRVLFTTEHHWSDLLLHNPSWTLGHSEHLAHSLMTRISAMVEREEPGVERFLKQLFHVNSIHPVIQESDTKGLLRMSGVANTPSASLLRNPAQVEITSLLLALFAESLEEDYAPLYHHWKKIARGSRYSSTIPGIIIANKHAPLSVLRDMASDSNMSSAHCALAGSARALNDPEVTGALLLSSDPDVTEKLFRHLSSDPVVSFRKIAEVNPVSASKLLPLLDTRASLRYEDILPLLTSSEAEVRLQAMTWWGVREGVRGVSQEAGESENHQEKPSQRTLWK